MTEITSPTDLPAPLPASMPVAAPDDVASEIVATTASETAREEASGVVWMIAIAGIAFVVAGWFLPWYVEETANGVGYSPMDAVLTFTGPGTICIYVIGVAMLALIAGMVYDTVATASHRGHPFRYSRARAALAGAGALATVVIAVLVGVLHEEPLFGNLDQYAFADNAVWMTLTGFCLLAFAYGARPWIVDHGGIAFTAVAFSVGAAFPMIFNQSADFVGWGARFAAIYVLLALGLNVVVGFAGLLDLGYAAFFAIGAYVTASFGGSHYGLHLPFWVLIFLGAAVAALFGAILGAPTLRLRGDYLAIVTLGFGEIVPDLATNLQPLTGGPNGLQADSASFAGYSLGQLGAIPANSKYYFWLLLVLAALVVVALRNIERSRLGRAWVAIREDEIAAAATGINTVSGKLLAFAIGASVSGFAGAFFASMLGTVTPANFGFAVSVTALTTVVLGGIGNIAGVTVGAILVAFVINWVLPNIQDWSNTFARVTGVTGVSTIQYGRFVYIIYGLVLIGIMMLRPAGLLPSRARKVELVATEATESLAAVQGKA
jgi:branched-chain amino acid transport system permease protein